MGSEYTAEWFKANFADGVDNPYTNQVKNIVERTPEIEDAWPKVAELIAVNPQHYGLIFWLAAKSMTNPFRASKSNAIKEHNSTIPRNGFKSDEEEENSVRIVERKHGIDIRAALRETGNSLSRAARGTAVSTQKTPGQERDLVEMRRNALASYLNHRFSEVRDGGGSLFINVSVGNFLDSTEIVEKKKRGLDIDMLLRNKIKSMLIERAPSGLDDPAFRGKKLYGALTDDEIINVFEWFKDAQRGLVT